MPQRINIAIDVKQHGASKKTELPFKLLVTGNYSKNNNNKNNCYRNIKNIDDLLKKIQPTLDLNLPSPLQAKKTGQKFQFNPKSKKDFHPDQLIQQIPVLREIQGLRNLILDLRNRWILEKKLRQECQFLLESGQTENNKAKNNI